MLLLSRVPELPDLLSITRQQTLIFFITLLVAELGVSRHLRESVKSICEVHGALTQTPSAAALPARRAADAGGAFLPLRRAAAAPVTPSFASPFRFAAGAEAR